MLELGERSRRELATCHPDLQRVINRAIRVLDFTVLQGHRSNAEQDRLFAQGKSRNRGGAGKHNQWPSEALDLAPWPVNWKDTKGFYVLAGVVLAAAHEEGVKIRWGGNWDGDADLNDNSLVDPGHFELVL